MFSLWQAAGNDIDGAAETAELAFERVERLIVDTPIGPAFGRGESVRSGAAGLLAWPRLDERRRRDGCVPTTTSCSWTWARRSPAWSTPTGRVSAGIRRPGRARGMHSVAVLHRRGDVGAGPAPPERSRGRGSTDRQPCGSGGISWRTATGTEHALAARCRTTGGPTAFETMGPVAGAPPPVTEARGGVALDRQLGSVRAAGPLRERSGRAGVTGPDPWARSRWRRVWGRSARASGSHATRAATDDDASARRPGGRWSSGPDCAAGPAGRTPGRRGAHAADRRSSRSAPFGAWFRLGDTQMDDQQHALSALLILLDVRAAIGATP